MGQADSAAPGAKIRDTTVDWHFMNPLMKKQ
jgi:hypothetical protein